jgi:hypothetical protein
MKVEFFSFHSYLPEQCVETWQFFRIVFQFGVILQKKEYCFEKEYPTKQTADLNRDL